MRRLRIIGLSLLALGVPAFAFGGEQAPSPGSLSVSASLGGCGLANAAIVCRIDASWTGPEGATYYTVSVTRADGSVVDVGQSSGTSRSIYVPYVGPGSYSVQVTAWGAQPGEEDPQVLAREESMSTAGKSASGGASTHPGEAAGPGEPQDPGDVVDGATGAEDPVTEPPPAEPPPPPPACEEEQPPPEELPEDPAEPDADASGAVAEAPAEPLVTEDEPEDPACP